MMTLYRLWNLIGLFWRPVLRRLTLGVKAIAFDEAGRVLLVRHRYIPGWHFPGGGVKWRERAEEALIRELREEASVAAECAPELFGFYSNFRDGQSDHVAVFVLTAREDGPWRPNLEIVERGFFPLDALPESLSPSTIRRLKEYRGEREQDGVW